MGQHLVDCPDLWFWTFLEKFGQVQASSVLSLLCSSLTLVYWTLRTPSQFCPRTRHPVELTALPLGQSVLELLSKRFIFHFSPVVRIILFEL